MTTCPIDHRLPVMVLPTDANGLPRDIQGAPVVTCSDLAIAHIEPGPTPLEFFVVPTGKPGHVSVSVRCDTRLGESMKALSAILEIDFVVPEAELLAFSVGGPLPMTP